MPAGQFIVTVHTKDDVEPVKNHVISEGGKIVHEYSLIHGFSCVFPPGHVSTLDSHPKVKAVEPDGVATTQ